MKTMTKILGLCMALMLMMAVPTTAQTADSLAAADVAATDTTLAATDSLTAGADDLQAIADDEAHVTGQKWRHAERIQYKLPGRFL